LWVRNVAKIGRVHDVCPVTSPAYSDATAAKRSLDSYQQDHPTPPTSHAINEAMRARELELAGY